jgi:hypothetical protein
MTEALVASNATNYTAIAISVGIPLVVLGVIAAIVIGYLRLQANRADAVAMAHYRRLAHDAVASQQELRTELVSLTEKVEAVDRMMREVG